MPMMLTHVIRAVIFDLDGTLVHSLSGIAKALNTILERHHLPTHSESTVRTSLAMALLNLSSAPAQTVMTLGKWPNSPVR